MASQNLTPQIYLLAHLCLVNCLKVNGYLLQFKLAPAFGLYMVIKHHLSSEFQIPISSSEGKKSLTLALKNIITQFKKAVKVLITNKETFVHVREKKYSISQRGMSVNRVCMLSLISFWYRVSYPVSSNLTSMDNMVS